MAYYAFEFSRFLLLYKIIIRKEIDSYIFIYVYREREKKGHERGKYMNENDYLKFREKEIRR